MDWIMRQRKDLTLRITSHRAVKPSAQRGTSSLRPKVQIFLFDQHTGIEEYQPSTGWESERSSQKPFPLRQLCLGMDRMQLPRLRVKQDR
jgi:hypothetical protein